jgi:predicted metalloprotease with PDZ domain
MFALASFLAVAVRGQSRDPIVIQIDASDVRRNLIHVKEEIPATPGQFLIRFPKWIPGDHSPSGPLRNAIQMHIFAGNQELPWRRDDVELFDIHVNVPQGANRLRVEFIDGESIGDVATSTLARLKINHMIFLPKGPVEQMPIRATVQVPSGWQAFDALPFTRTGDTLQFTDTNAERLVDSTILIGKYGKAYEVQPGHELCVVGDEAKDIVATPEELASVKNIVDEAHAIWGAQHYRSYKWLLTVSNFGAFDGTEHNECSDDGVGADGLTSGLPNSGLADLLCHEYTHSWNGKYRRPEGLYQPDYATAQHGALLWVYEGMTQYWGHVLSARAGILDATHFRDTVAGEAARLAIKDGRQWKSTEDTAVEASIDRHPQAPWANAFRGQDYYQEGVLLWIGVDANIRHLTNGQKSLNDFCHLFAGGPDTGPKIVTYRYEDIVKWLNQVAPYDWDGYLKKMVYAVHPTPTTEGLEAAGWKLVFNDQPGGAGAGHFFDIGMDVGSDGSISDMLLGSAAEKGGVAPGMKILTVNNKPYADDALNDAIKAGTTPGNPIVLLVTKDNVVSTLQIDYAGGLKYPHLEQIPGATDYLTQSIQPLVKAAAK